MISWAGGGAVIEFMGDVVWLVAGQVEGTGAVLPFRVFADSMEDAKGAIESDEPGITPIAAISLEGIRLVLEKMRGFMGRRGEDNPGRVWSVTRLSLEGNEASEIVVSDTREEAVRLAGVGEKKALVFNLEDACSVENSLLQFCAQVTDADAAICVVASLSKNPHSLCGFIAGAPPLKQAGPTHH
jgi:hypothetical protein